MARKLPDPRERSVKEPAVLCDSDRVLALYNRVNKPEKQRFSKSVRDWFLATAQEEGWDAAIFLNHVETGHSAGCVLYKGPPSVVSNNFIAANTEEGDEGALEAK